MPINLESLYSSEAAAWIDDESLDAVFIDANHTYAALSADLRAWMPKVRRGGLVSGHDFSIFFHGVVQAVLEVLPEEVTLQLAADTVWFFFKP